MSKFFKVALFLGLAPTMMLASGGGTDYDIVPRTINFLIFVAILIYLLKNPAKNFYKGRISKISSRLEDIQKKVLESKNRKLELVKSLEDTKKEGEQAKIDAVKEAEILAAKIKEDAQNELDIMQRYFDEQKNYERRKMRKALVAELLGEIFNSKENELSQDEILEIMLKKVS